MSPTPRSLDRWLILDRPVFEALLTEPCDPQGLFSFRIERRLVEHTALPAIGPRLSALRAAGYRRVRIVAEQLTAEVLQHLRAHLADNPVADLRDWYRSSDAVLASLYAPDPFIVDRLTDRGSNATIALWPPLAAIEDDRKFVADYRTALAHWERAARDEHGGEFVRRYGDPISWNEVLPDRETSTSDRWSLPARLGRLFRLSARSDTGGSEASGHWGLAAAMGEAAAGAGPLEWVYTVDDDRLVKLRVDLPSRVGAKVEVFVELGPGVRAPLGFALVDEGDVLIVAPLTPDWHGLGAERGRIAYHSFADEFGELRARFEGLRVKPRLLLL